MVTEVDQAHPAAATEPPATDDPAAALAAQAQAQADRIAAAGGMHATDAHANPPREIIWRDLAMEPQANTAIDPEPAQPDTQPQVTPAAAPVDSIASAEAEPAKTQSNPKPASQPSVSPYQAYEQYLRTVRQSNDSNLSKALIAATLGAVGPHGELDWSLLTSLSPQDQERVKRYHRAIVALHAEALIGQGAIDRDALNGRLQELYSDQPITIRSIELCEKVLGFGVYDPFPNHTFVAGREQKMIVYVELDHFQSAPRAEGDGYEVRLRQELELYESNGFEVWSHEPVQIVDVSRNQRRDFFVVQLVTLPAQLALGEYRLKVRVYDENAGTRDETTIPITMVADETLVSKTKP
jgi:hypothetical protein